jgi:hypothetical protein
LEVTDKNTRIRIRTKMSRIRNSLIFASFWCLVLFNFSFRAIARASVIITTPEKWDGVSRSWQTRDFVRDVTLIVIDEIHLLGEDRGPVREKKQFAKW